MQKCCNFLIEFHLRKTIFSLSLLRFLNLQVEFHRIPLLTKRQVHVVSIHASAIEIQFIILAINRVVEVKRWHYFSSLAARAQGKPRHEWLPRRPMDGNKLFSFRSFCKSFFFLWVLNCWTNIFLSTCNELFDLFSAVVGWPERWFMASLGFTWGEQTRGDWGRDFIVFW